MFCIFSRGGRKNQLRRPELHDRAWVRMLIAARRWSLVVVFLVYLPFSCSFSPSYMKKRPASKVAAEPSPGDIEDMEMIEDGSTLRKSLLSWYDRERRALPWRGDAPPYGNHLTHECNQSAGAVVV